MSDARGLPPPADDRRALGLRAATIFERLQLASSHPPAAATPEAQQVLDAWRQAFSAGTLVPFLRRLAWDGLTPDAVLAALSATADPVPDSVPPTWTAWIDRYRIECRAFRDRSAGAPPFFATVEAEPPFVELLLPGLAVARRELGVRLATTCHDAVHPDVNLALARHLLDELARQTELVLFDTFTSRREEQGVDADPEGREFYDLFIDELLAGGMDAVFAEYPVLARHVALVLDTWVAGAEELMRRAAEDREAIARTFSNRTDPGGIVGLDPALSDPHRGRRRVARVRFASGLRLVYKPRDISLEAAFFSLLRELGGLGLDPAPPSLITLARPGYGWVEHAEAGTAGGRQEVANWFRCAGALICIAHLLRGRDLHMDNVVATSRGPVLIDLEVLLQPLSAPDAARVVSGHGAEPAGDSCLSTGLLSDIQTGPDGTVFDVGGLRGDGRGLTPVKQRRWHSQGSDGLGFAEVPAFVIEPANRLLADGRLQRPEEFAAEITEGFERAYRLLHANRGSLLAPEGSIDRFDRHWTRVIGRPTDQYAALLHVVTSPRYQRSGAIRSAALEALNRPFSLTERRPPLWPLAAEERRSLDALDIPVFHARTDSTDVFSDGRPLLTSWFGQSGLSAVRRRLAEMSETDLTRQTATLRRALAASVDSRFTADLVLPRAVQSAMPAPGPTVVSHALWIARECLARAEEAGGHRGAPASLADVVLYDGDLGLALFHAAVAATTDSSVSRAAANEAVDRLSRASVEADLGFPIGACAGRGSIVYALACIGRLLDEGGAVALSARFADGITPERIAADGYFDVSGGAAGAIFALLTLYGQTDDPRLLRAAVLCGEHLIASRQDLGTGCAWRAADGRLYTGFAHGAAGIGAALVRLAAASGRRDFLDTAARAHAFVQAVYLKAQANWPVVTSDDGSAAEVMTAWCHGAPGIALARVLAAVTLGDRSLLSGLDAPLRTTASVPVRLDDHLCCGNMGRCDVLLTVGAHLRVDALVEAAWTTALQVVDRATRDRRYRLTSRGYEPRVFDTRFFRGLPGIGYQLLRLAAPTRLPSILSFDAPPAAT